MTCEPSKHEHGWAIFTLRDCFGRAGRNALKGGVVILAHKHRVDVLDGAVRLLDLARSYHQRVHELAEVVLEGGQVHEVVLDYESLRFVVEEDKTYVVSIPRRIVGLG